VDTTRAAVAEAALGAGATIVNDISGGLADPDMATVVAAAGVPWVLMHWRGHSRDMQALATYEDVVADVRTELRRQSDIALAAGVEPDRIVLDPGLGFAKTAEHNWSLLARLDEIVAIGFPVLVGASRKSFLGKVLAGSDGVPVPVDRRENATVATSVLAAVMGAWGVRVHEVRPTVEALRVVQAWSRAAEHAAAAEEVGGPPVPRPPGTGRG
jgi:dihydropteroate synthase